MEKKYKVSVIVPVYNVEKYLEKCLDSLIHQTLDSLQIIVVNDGSQDNSQSIIDRYVNKYPELVLGLKKDNGGLGDARNYGLSYATGEYIGFVDSDDWVDEKMYEFMYSMATTENLDCVICDFTSIYDGWKSGWLSRGYRGKESNPDQKEFLRFSMEPATACNKLIKSEMFYVKKFSEIWYEDMATTPVLLSYANRIGYLPIPLYYYRQQDNSITHAVRNPKTLDVMKAWDISLTTCKKEYQKEIEYAIYKSICNFVDFKPEYASEFIQYAEKCKGEFNKNSYIINEIKNNNLPEICSMQLIPKKIHYFWFGSAEKSELIKKCIASWKNYAPDYEIIEWNESNCDVTECDYVREAYENKKWAFVADYFRIKKIYEEGGIYFDTDVELTSDIASLSLNKIFFAFETKTAINAAVFGAIPHHSLLKEWLDTYKKDHLVKRDGSLDTSNTIVVRLTNILKQKYNLNLNGKTQVVNNEIKLYAPNILTLDMYDGKNIAQHHYDASWWDAKAGVTSYKYEVLKDYFSSTPEMGKDETMQYINLLEQQIRDYENSTCWKITKPLRMLMGFLRREK